MKIQKFLFVPYDTRDSPEVRRILSGIQEEKKEKRIPFVVLFFSLIFNFFFAFCVIAAITLPPGSLGPTAKKMIFAFCVVVVAAAMGVLIGMLGWPRGED